MYLIKFNYPLTFSKRISKKRNQNETSNTKPTTNNPSFHPFIFKHPSKFLIPSPPNIIYAKKKNISCLAQQRTSQSKVRAEACHANPRNKSHD